MSWYIVQPKLIHQIEVLISVQFKYKHAFTLCEKVDACPIPSNIEIFRQAPPWLSKGQTIRPVVVLLLFTAMSASQAIYRQMQSINKHLIHFYLMTNTKFLYSNFTKVQSIFKVCPDKNHGLITLRIVQTKICFTVKECYNMDILVVLLPSQWGLLAASLRVFWTRLKTTYCTLLYLLVFYHNYNVLKVHSIALYCICVYVCVPRIRCPVC